MEKGKTQSEKVQSSPTPTIKQKIKNIQKDALQLLSFDIFRTMNGKKVLPLTRKFSFSTQMLLQQILERYHKKQLEHRYSPLTEVRSLLAEKNGAFSKDSPEIIDFFKQAFQQIEKYQKFIFFRKKQLDKQLNSYSQDQQTKLKEQIKAFFKQ